MLLTGKQEGAVLGERTDLDYMKEKLQAHIDKGVPVDHPSLDKLRKQIELMEGKTSMEQLSNQIKTKGQLNG